MNSLDFLDMLTILSFYVGLLNLELNIQQVTGLDSHLQIQDTILRDEQNVMLQKIIDQNESIISILKEMQNAQKNS